MPLFEKPAPSDASGEEDEAADVGLLAAEEVGERPGGQHQDGRADHVGEDHPDELEQAGAEGALQVGQGDDQRPGVDRREQHPEARAAEGPPLVVVVLRGDPGLNWLRWSIDSYVHVRINISAMDSRPRDRLGGHTVGVPMDRDRLNSLIQAERERFAERSPATPAALFEEASGICSRASR